MLEFYKAIQQKLWLNTTLLVLVWIFQAFTTGEFDNFMPELLSNNGIYSSSDRVIICATIAGQTIVVSRSLFGFSLFKPA